MKKLSALFPLAVTLAACGAYQPADCELDNSCPQLVTCDSKGVCRPLLVLAAADYYATPEDGRLVIPAWRGLLANDADRTGNGLVARLVTSPLHGAVSLEKDGSFVYVPGLEFSGDDSFEYEATSGTERSLVSRVTIRVAPVNDHRPVGRTDTYVVATNGMVNLDAKNGVLGNDADPDDDRLDAMLQVGPAHGRLWLRTNGSFTYIPKPGFTGIDCFTYVAYDGIHETAPIRVTLRVGMKQTVVLDTPASQHVLKSVEALEVLITCAKFESVGLPCNNDNSKND